MSIERVREAYGTRASEYIELFAEIDAAAERDREDVVAWARTVTGRVLDVGCGPGHWTAFLDDAGIDVAGVDPVRAFVDEARRRHPHAAYSVGQAEQLDAGDAELGGILAWYSLIHTDPDQIGGCLTEFARCIRPEGGLLVGFFEGAELAPFEHAVTTAYTWPVELLGARLERAGFEIIAVRTRSDPGTRPHASIEARRAR